MGEGLAAAEGSEAALSLLVGVLEGPSSNWSAKVTLEGVRAREVRRRAVDNDGEGASDEGEEANEDWNNFT